MLCALLTRALTYVTKLCFSLPPKAKRVDFLISRSKRRSSMAFDLSRAKACSSTATVYVIFNLLIFVTLITSFSWLEFQNYITAPDQDPPHKRTLEVVPVPVPAPQPQVVNPTPAGITCDRSHSRFDLCSINGPVVLDPTRATLYSVRPPGPISSVEKVKPYPRKWEHTMAKIREVELKSGPIGGPPCDVHHDSPALVFSAGGHTGNFFHDFNDGFLPLYITLHNVSVVDRDVILVVDSAREWWVKKYADLIRALTKHPIINLENDTFTHCFTRATVGLVSHGYMDVDPNALPNPLTIVHFHSFIRSAYEQEAAGPRPTTKGRPKLVWLARAGSVGRVIKNQDEARGVAKEVGFDVVIYKPRKNFPLRDAYKIINGSHAMIGVHGAAMTHMWLLRPGSALVQVVPLGLEWVAEVCYERPARDVSLEYTEYKLWYNESTLSTKYNKENPVVKDANTLLEKKGWVQKLMNVYLKEQDVKLDLDRFRVYMKKVYEQAKRFMDLHG